MNESFKEFIKNNFDIDKYAPMGADDELAINAFYECYKHAYHTALIHAVKRIEGLSE